jgi:hypothetical protein
MRSRWRDPVPRNGIDGRDADPAELERAVREQVAKIRKPEDGRDADPAAIFRQIQEAVARIEIPVAKNGEPGKRGPRGPKGDTGDDGPVGPKPRHEWKETELRFEKADGTWGKYVDLRGPPGFGGGGGVVHVEAPPFDIDSLPIGDTSTPEEIVVKQNGIWVRISWSDFMTLIGTPLETGLSLNGDDLSLNGDLLDLT